MPTREEVLTGAGRTLVTLHNKVRWFALISQSTDSREPRTTIQFTTNVDLADEFDAGGGDFTYENPEAARNFHHTLHYVYEVPEDFDYSEADCRAEAEKRSSRDYPKSWLDILADRVRAAGWVYQVH